MTTPAELSHLLRIHPDTPRIAGYGSDANLMREKGAQAVAISVQLLDPDDKTPSGKWLVVQVQPADALILMGAIFEHAKEQDWQIPANLLQEIEATQLAPDTKKN